LNEPKSKKVANRGKDGSDYALGGSFGLEGEI